MSTEKRAEPRLGKVVRDVLASIGVEKFEESVVNQGMDFVHRYIVQMLEEARVYSGHAEREDILLDDVQMAAQMFVNHKLMKPLPEEFVLESARETNRRPLPVFPMRGTTELPPPELCTSGPSYVVDVKKSSQAQQSGQSAPGGPSQ